MAPLIPDPYFTKHLPADTEQENFPRQVYKACFSWVKPKPVKQARLLAYSAELAHHLGLDPTTDDLPNLLSGNTIPNGTKPFAQCYGGHQFGHWAGQLGDGRAIALGEFTDHNKQRQMLQLKGAGPTPYSRTADGFAVLRSSLREFVCSEAMHSLGIPTSRALSLCTTGEKVWRDILYNGNAKPEDGAVVCRVAPSFLRIGNFELLNQRQDDKTLKQLTGYCITTFFPHLAELWRRNADAAIVLWFEEVCHRNLKVVVDWARVGFVHGVLNTDNVSILGLTLDYGPYGWLDRFNPDWTPNLSDHQHRRYRFGEQFNVMRWNCYQLAIAIAPLIESTEDLESILNKMEQQYQQQWLKMMFSKLGIENITDTTTDFAFVTTLENLLQEAEMDMTLFYRELMALEINDSIEHQADQLLQHSYLIKDAENPHYKQSLMNWLKQYYHRLQQNTCHAAARKIQMAKVNPLYIFRNYLAAIATEKAESGEKSFLQDLMKVLETPYTEQTEPNVYAQKTPKEALNKIGCSVLSCSS